MNTNELRYRGFVTTINYEAETNTFYGKLEGIKDLVTWESEEEDFFFIYTAFVEAVDDYLEFCDEVGAMPRYIHPRCINIDEEVDDE